MIFSFFFLRTFTEDEDNLLLELVRNFQLGTYIPFPKGILHSSATKTTSVVLVKGLSRQNTHCVFITNAFFLLIDRSHEQLWFMLCLGGSRFVSQTNVVCSLLTLSQDVSCIVKTVCDDTM